MNLILHKLCLPPQLEYVLIDSNLIIIETSNNASRFADIPNQLTIGQDVRLSFPELVGIEDILNSILDREQTNFDLKGISRYQQPDQPIYFDLYIGSIENQLILLFEDVTETMLLKQSLVQRASEAEILLSALTISRDYINKILVSMGDALLVTNNSGLIKTLNQAAENLFGYGNLELFNQPIETIIQDHNFQRQALQNQILQQPENINNLELECRQKQNSSIIVEFSVVAIATEIKNIPAFIYIGRDITDRKRIEAEKRKALEKEKELTELKARFVSMASHEFRNPVTTILTAIELLESYGEQLEPEQQKIYLNYIKKSAQTMKNILEDVLVINRAESGKLEFNPTILNLEQLCQNLIKELQISTGENRIKFICRGNCQQVYMDSNLIRYMLNNLLSNSLKYSSSDTIVNLELDCQTQTGIAKLKIQDQGIGIPEADLDKIFDSFHRASNIGNISGTGLGLSIVKRAVELHQGTIRLESKINLGTNICVTLPLHNGSVTRET